MVHQLLVYVDYSILGGRVPTIKKTAEALVVASKEIRLEVNADETKYMVMSQDQNAGRSHNMKIDNSSFERVGELKYLGTTTFYSGRNYEEISLGAESLVIKLTIQKYKDLVHRTILLRYLC
jgi:hypothetical protein